MDLTIGQLAAMLFGSVWAQGGLVALALGSVAYDKLDVIKNAGENAVNWFKSRSNRPDSTSAKNGANCEQRRLTLVGIRHTASELKDPAKRTAALALCDQMDELAATLYPEAA